MYFTFSQLVIHTLVNFVRKVTYFFFFFFFFSSSPSAEQADGLLSLSGDGFCLEEYVFGRAPPVQ
jgi:hypothetical protein